MAKKVTKTQAEFVLAKVAEWLGPKMGYEGAAPTGDDAAYVGQGPALNMEWDWPSSGPTPTILLEGGPYDWAVECSWDVQREIDKSKAHAGKVWVEPYAGYALCVYRND